MKGFPFERDCGARTFFSRAVGKRVRRSFFGMELKLKKFDMKMIGDESVVVMLGKRGCGKSIIMKALLANQTTIPLGVVISPTEQANQFYGDFVPKMFIYDEYDNKIIDNVVKRQTAAVKAMRREEANFGSSNIDPRGFLILDDCMYDQSWTKDKNMRFLFLNGRHVRVLLCITQQYVLGLPPTMRSNIDYTFILRENSIQNRRKIFENYAGVFPSFELFCHVMDHTTNNYECMVICNRSQSNKLQDTVFWYKAPLDINPYKLCHPNYWALDRQCRKEENAGDGEEIFDLDKLRKKAPPNVKIIKA